MELFTKSNVMRSTTIKFANGDTITTSINGTVKTIKEYYRVGSAMNIGSVEDNMQTITSCSVKADLYCVVLLIPNQNRDNGIENYSIKTRNRYYFFLETLGEAKIFYEKVKNRFNNNISDLSCDEVCVRVDEKDKYHVLDVVEYNVQF